MTDNEIIKALEWWLTVANNTDSITLSKEDIFAINDLINRQKAEIEGLLHSVQSLSGHLSSAKFDAVYKYMKILEAKLAQNNDISGFAYQSVIWDMSQSYSEVVGE